MPRHTTPLSLDLAKSLRDARDATTDATRIAELDELIAATPTVRYHPLSGFGAADYVSHYASLLDTSGALDKLRFSSAELSLDKERLDLAGFAALGVAITTLLTNAASTSSAGTLRMLIIDHCSRFRVQIHDNARGVWVPLYIEAGQDGNAAEAIDQHLDFGQMIELVRALAGGVLRPLWSRLRSSAVATEHRQVKPSESAPPAS